MAKKRRKTRRRVKKRAKRRVRKRSRTARTRRKAKKRAKRKKKRLIRKTKKRFRKKLKKVAITVPAKPKLPKINKIPDQKAYDLLKKAGLPLTKQFFCRKEKDLEPALKKIGYPCVMKTSGKTIIHRDHTGVVKDIENEEQAGKIFVKLKKIKGADSVLIQQQVLGKEVILGSKFDPQFGHIVSIGIGGDYASFLKDVSFRICPINIIEAENMVKELKGYEILKGIGKEKSINLQKLHESLVKLSKFAIKEKISEMNIAPLICNHEKCFVTEASIIK